MSQIPKRYQEFMEKYPEIVKVYEELRNAVHSSDTLDDKKEHSLNWLFQLAQD